MDSGTAIGRIDPTRQRSSNSSPYTKAQPAIACPDVETHARRHQRLEHPYRRMRPRLCMSVIKQQHRLLIPRSRYTVRSKATALDAAFPWLPCTLIYMQCVSIHTDSFVHTWLPAPIVAQAFATGQRTRIHSEPPLWPPGPDPKERATWSHGYHATKGGEEPCSRQATEVRACKCVHSVAFRRAKLSYLTHLLHDQNRGHAQQIACNRPPPSPLVSCGPAHSQSRAWRKERAV